MTTIYLTALAVFSISALITGGMRRVAISQGFLDVPNSRSSHKRPIPLGGGVAIVFSSTAAILTLTLVGRLPVQLLVALAGGLGVAIVGFLDDRHGLSVGVRFAVHAAVAVWALVWVGDLSSLRGVTHALELSWLACAFAVIALVWTLNLFNFMDGIDGIAASEAVFIAVAGALLSMTGDRTTGVSTAGIVFAGACAGFLIWNWPPARIFMGDAGSGYVGYTIAVLGIAATRENPNAVWVWLILGGVFLVDATVTLVRRTLRGERVHEAHRTHGYQWLARRWESHRRVTLAVMAVNVLWLLPLAWLAATHPKFGLWIALAALVPLVAVAIAAGAGRSELSSS